MRCFWFGALGLIPGFGLGLAGISLRLFKVVSRANGSDMRAVSFPLSLLFVTLAANPLLQIGVGWPAAVVLLCGMICLLNAWTFRQFVSDRAGKWNPARAWAWSGAACATTGIFLSLTLLEIFYAEAFHRRLLGI